MIHQLGNWRMGEQCEIAVISALCGRNMLEEIASERRLAVEENVRTTMRCSKLFTCSYTSRLK
jgi:hypothetical protein